MELFLNLIWLAVSAALGALLLLRRKHWEAAPKGCLSKGCISQQATAWMAYLILIALMLPAISMTDDLLAMAVSTDEQIARRYEISPAMQSHADLHLTLYPAVQASSWASLSCSGVLEIESSPSVSHPFLKERRRGRAPPTAG